jgi:carboxypeptidase family protein/TonB-dependent receptor-like protein
MLSRQNATVKLLQVITVKRCDKDPEIFFLTTTGTRVGFQSIRRKILDLVFKMKARRQMRSVWVKLLMLIVVFQFGMVDRALAQAERAEITGTVSDPSGAAVPGATVEVIQVSTKLKKSLTTNDAGVYYTKTDVGEYQVRVQAAGFQEVVLSNIQLSVGNTMRQDITLQVGSTTETLNVTATAGTASLNSENATVSMILDNKMVETLPVITRRVYELLVTVPGTTFSGQALSSRGFDASIFQPFVSLGGSPSGRGNIWVMNGVNIKNTRLTGDTGGMPAFNPPPEIVQEMRVLFNNYSAEFGDSAGGAGAVDIATKQGTNAYHGQLFYYGQNNAFDARNTFRATKLPNHYHNFGGTVGGPIIKDKTFFNVNLMWMRQFQTTQAFETVPSLAQRRGDFSQTFNAAGNLIPIYDPLTTCGQFGNPACALDASGNPIITRQQFPGNIIPQGRLDPVALNILSHYPTPNAAGTIAGSGNFTALAHSTANRNNVQYFRVDHQFNEKNHLNVMWARDYLLLTPCGSFCAQEQSMVADITASRYWINGKTFIAALDTVVKTSVVNDFRFAYVGNSFHSQALFNVDGVWNQNWAGKLGLKNVGPETFPWVNAAGFSNMGGQARGQQEYYASIWHNWVVQDHMSWIRGKHNFRFGGEFKPMREVNASRLTTSGALTFDTLATAQPNVSGTGSSIASMLLGRVATSTHLDQTPLDRRSWFLGTFIQDDWRIRKNITLNLGLRWEYDRPTYDTSQGFNTFDATTINPVSGTPGVVKFARILQAQGGQQVGFYESQYNHFQPRLGVAWSPTDKWVIRGGAGVFNPGQDQGTSMWGAPNLGNQIYAQTLTQDGLGLNSPFVLSQGFPLYAQPPLNDAFGAVPVGQSPTLAFSYIPYDTPVQRMLMTNFNIQRQIGSTFKVEGGYLGNYVYNLSHSFQVNEVPLDKRGPGNAQVVRAFSQYGNMTQLASFLGRSRYNAGYVALSKSFSHGLSFETNYTHSKMLATGTYAGYYKFLADPNTSYGPTSFDIPDRFVWSGLYDLPIGPGKKFLDSGWPGKVFGGWKVGGYVAMYSGFPLSVTPLANTGNCFCPQGVNVVKAPTYNSNFQPGPTSTWFDTTAFSPAAPFTFGNSGVGILRGPGFRNLDASLAKKFHISERYSFDVRADFFDAFNHPNYGNPNTQLGNANFGRILATAGVGGNRTLQISGSFFF